MKTIIQTQIEGEQWQATTPHTNEVKATANTESQAVSLLCTGLRERFAQGPIAWDVKAKGKRGKDIITRELSGLWPQNIKPEAPEPAQQTRSDEDGNH